MSTRTRYLRALTLIGGSVFLVSCTENGTTPTDLTDEGATFAVVLDVLAEDCGSCHSTDSGRAFRVDMDSASFVASGFINPANAATSLIFTKPRSASAHGGGVVANFTDQDIAQLTQWVELQPVLNLNILDSAPQK
jgi:uncharacterized membrane protein